MLTASGLAVSALLLQGCLFLPKQRSLPNPAIPHQVAESSTLTIWVRRPDNSLVKETVRVDPGWFVASPQVVEPQP
jgi:hypothetical protein